MNYLFFLILVGRRNRLLPYSQLISKNNFHCRKLFLVVVANSIRTCAHAIRKLSALVVTPPPAETKGSFSDEPDARLPQLGCRKSKRIRRVPLAMVAFSC